MSARLALFLVLAACAAPSAGPAGRDIVFAGEIHDNPEHHAVQAQVARGLAPAAIVFEMIPATNEAEANRLRAAGADRAALAAALDWGNSGWPDFAFYAGVMEAAPSARIYGAEVPRADTRRAIREGAASVLGADAARFGLDTPLTDAEQAERETEQRIAHCDALPPALLPGMVEAQRLRDAALAAAALRALAETGGPVLVIAGNGHVRTDRGAPALLLRAAPEVTVFTLGQGEGPVPDAPYDSWREAPPVARPDPCAAFRSG
jgi:uncharacterized iron-regulated protein